MNDLKITGGARIGWMNATWPFATLKVTKESLELNAAIIGKLVFLPNDIINIEPYGIIPLLGQGIRINHNVPNYNHKVIFWTFKNSLTLIKEIQLTGFLDNYNTKNGEMYQEIKEQQNSGGFPIKKPFGIGIIVLWNILIISDLINASFSATKGIPLGIGTITALGIVIAVSILLLISKNIQKIILKGGRTGKDILRFLVLLIFVCGIILTALLKAKHLI